MEKKPVMKNAHFNGFAAEGEAEPVNTSNQHQFIENNGDEKLLVYDSILLAPEMLSVLSSELALKVVQELAKEPGCAMDLARKLGEHEQKIYYHIRNLEKVGVIKHIGVEQRYGMTAKIYTTVTPIVSAKLFEGGVPLIEKPRINDPKVAKFLEPFIVDGKLDALIVIGWPYPHGRYEATPRDSPYLIDLISFLTSFLHKENRIAYKFDTEVTEDDLKNNIILIGNSKINTVTDKLNRDFPLHFDENKDFGIVSNFTNKVYSYDYDAVVLKTKNPVDPKKSILLLAGKRSQGLKSAIMAFINFTDKIMEGNSVEKKVIAKVVTGIDKNGDGNIDSVKILE